ncbi:MULTISPECIES: TetR/AcrR family transcriptional regulator C-terminal domain-containing protein [Streptacidiphilus]|uniref:TetR/AcrR family transcriptional regulator C-terminal domain-containing protein n=1 Tax=Streptacidiphilus cavernicola TaxID=3342716 RepID=A0ABV6UH60_9ACTN|nr:TetR/AcrR family transcriptional regulator C-terminal domain-containing protein [Streptacidiphilus jeojiense]
MSADQQGLPSVWTRPQRSRRDQPALSRDQIVSAALELLDAEGIDALSMRKLGTRLNAGATSMYSHVANKDELIELVVDEVYGEIDLTGIDSSTDWRTAVTRLAHGLRNGFLRHPWIASALGQVGMAALGPNLLRLSEALLGVFEEAGYSLQAAEQGMNTVSAYVIGVASTEAATLALLARSGQSQQEWVERFWPVAEQAVQGYPRLRRLYAAQREGFDVDSTRGDSFDEGLACILDGLEARRRLGDG